MTTLREKVLRKWEKICCGDGIDLGATNCEYCKKYRIKKCLGCKVGPHCMSCDFCTGCPLYENGQGCDNPDSAYRIWKKHIARKHCDWPFFGMLKIYCPTCAENAERMLNTLLQLEDV